MKTLVFLLEEPSAQDALEGILPKLLPSNVTPIFLVFEGKQDLEKRMARRMRGWLGANCFFVVLRDQDSGDCQSVKQRLVERCREGMRPDALVRIACHELEAWFIGDWTAVGEAFDRPRLQNLSRKALYRNPDRIASPVGELRKQIVTYQKRDGARRIGRCLNPDRNQSRSFHLFVEGIRRLIADAGDV